MYASIHYAIIGSDNGVSLVRRQAITQTNGSILLIGSLGANFIQEKGFKNIAYKMVVISFRP